jgi:hypothetical protein
VVAYLALFVALGGSAVAASGVLIKEPSQVGKGVITSRALKDHAGVNVKDLTRKALAILRTPGPKGDTGPRGERGLTGDSGPPGPATGSAGGALTGNYPDPELKGAEAAHLVGSLGEPPFLKAQDAQVFDGDCGGGDATWADLAGLQPAEFYRDPVGIVHLAGVVGDGLPSCAVFQLPRGYRPAGTELFAALASLAATERVEVTGGDGAVNPVNGDGNPTNYLSLSGISFRCAPSGADGCP